MKTIKEISKKYEQLEKWCEENYGDKYADGYKNALFWVLEMDD